MSYKVLITTSGTGSRLGELTKTTNKALLPINDRPAIAYIFDSYPADTEFIITVGYLGEQVQEALPRLFPDKHFSFVTVDCYDGPGSSLAYSMLCAEPLLQTPFIFHSCDTIVLGKTIPPADRNWVAGYVMEGDLSHYRTIEADGANTIVRIHDKKEGHSPNVLIGILGILDYVAYWGHLRRLYDANALDQTLNDTSPFNDMMHEGIAIKLVPFPMWLDTGNLSALQRTTEYYARV